MLMKMLRALQYLMVGVRRPFAIAKALTRNDISSLLVRGFYGTYRNPVPLSLISFFILSLICFRRNEVYLFYGLDGRYEVSLIASAWMFFPPLLGLTGDFIHGLGNVAFPVNPWFLPEYLFSAQNADFNNFALSYTISATELFLGTFICGRIIGAPRLASLVAAWIVPLLTLQYAGWGLIPSTFRAFPHYATIAALTALTATALLVIGKQSRRNAALAAGFAFLALSYIIVVAPTLLILGAPLLATAGLISFGTAIKSRSFGYRLALMTAIPVLCVVFGYPFFLLGLTADSVVPFFPNLSIRPGSLAEASLLFWNPMKPTFFTVERTFILLGLIGGGWAAVCAKGMRRFAAIAFIAAEFLYLAVGVVHAYRPFWYGPAPWYFEGLIIPFFALFTVTLFYEIAHSAFGMMQFRGALARFERPPWISVVLTLTIAGAPWLIVTELQKRAGPPNLPYYEEHPQPETPITRILKNEIMLKPGAQFRGRAATLTGRIFPLTTNVDFVGLSGIPDILAMQATGNLHSFAGLWQDAIPTLLEYSPLLTPAYFAFTRTFFTEPADRQIRNVVAMRRIDPRILGAVGVRFFVTDAPFDGAVRLRKTVPVPVTKQILKRLGIQQDIESFTLYLYEIDDVNLGQYSPIEIINVATANEMLQDLADPAINLAHTVVTADEVTQKLATATFGAFVVEKGHFRLQAKSEGWSVLVLPLEYSRCLRLDPSADTVEARLFRADVLLTGVLFNKNIDARLSYRTGPFIGSQCRLDDARDMKKMEIGNAFRDRPELAPIPITSY